MKTSKNPVKIITDCPLARVSRWLMMIFMRIVKRVTMSMFKANWAPANHSSNRSYSPPGKTLQYILPKTARVVIAPQKWVTSKRCHGGEGGKR